MAKKPTIPCDRCGERFDYIPDECPNCGEIILARMDPVFLERVEYIMWEPPYSVVVAKIIAWGVMLLGLALLLYGSGNPWEETHINVLGAHEWQLPKHIEDQLPPPSSVLKSCSPFWLIEHVYLLTELGSESEYWNGDFIQLGAILLIVILLLYPFEATRTRYTPQIELVSAGAIVLFCYFFIYFPSGINGLILAVCSVLIIIATCALLPPFYEELKEIKAINPAILTGSFALLASIIFIRNGPVFFLLPHAAIAVLFIALYFLQKIKWARYIGALSIIAFFMYGISYYAYCYSWIYEPQIGYITYSRSSEIAKMGFAAFVIPLIYILMIDVYLIFARGKKKPKENPVETPPNTD